MHKKNPLSSFLNIKHFQNLHYNIVYYKNHTSCYKLQVTEYFETL
jgi:hypothetical protein